MATNRQHEKWRASAYRGGRGFVDPYFCEWGAVVGDRVRRLRQLRERSLLDVAQALRKPEGGHYSAGFLSRLERGRASGPLYVYVEIADELEVDAGILLGPDTATLEATDAELTLLRCLRSAGIGPHDLLSSLIGARRSAPPPAPDPDADLTARMRGLLDAVDADE